MRVSVICVADRPERLPVLVWSLIAQTHRDWELIILDQSAEGDVARHCQSALALAGRAISVVRTDRVGDWGYTAKQAAAKALASGDAFLFPQDDAYYVPTALATLVAALEPGARVALCGWLYDLFGFAPMPPHPAIGHVDVGGFLVRRDVFLATGWPSTRQTADGEFIVEVAAGGGVALCPGVLYVRC